MRVSVFRHVPFETTGSIGDWLTAHNAAVSEILLYERHTLPDLTRTDLIVLMGGTMSVNDEESYAWLRAEKACITDAITRGIPVLGICLGSQLIANAMGARVYRNPQAEHGWFPVEATPTSGDTFRFPVRFTTFHSHGETFDLPTGAVRIAKSAACENQAFQIGRRAIALQFHLESTPQSAGAIVEECVDEFAAGPHVQSVDELRLTPRAAYHESVQLMSDVLDYITNGDAE
jgi:GMP synthase-like glutamine amidotransferase